MTDKQILSSRYYDMISRCYNENSGNYKYYGKKGILVCDEWIPQNNGKTNFITWALENGFDKNLSIDRINNNLGYSPSNCRWTTRRIQNINKKSSIKSSTGYVGICVHSSSYEGHIYYYGRVRNKNGKTEYTGISKNIREAIIKRNNYIIENELENQLNIVPEEI